MQLQGKSSGHYAEVHLVISLHFVSDLEHQQMWISNDMPQQQAHQFQSHSSFELAGFVAST